MAKKIEKILVVGAGTMEAALRRYLLPIIIRPSWQI